MLLWIGVIPSQAVRCSAVAAVSELERKIAFDSLAIVDMEFQQVIVRHPEEGFHDVDGGPSEMLEIWDQVIMPFKLSIYRANKSSLSLRRPKL
jgi:hypothetical protein